MAVSMSNAGLRPETVAAHALKAIDEATGAVVPPIHLSTTFARDAAYRPKLQENYQRNGNPTLW
jgi:cystathionine gamma-synthase